MYQVFFTMDNADLLVERFNNWTEANERAVCFHPHGAVRSRVIGVTGEVLDTYKLGV
jgi:hypothetical protein